MEGMAAGSSCSGGRGCRELLQWRAWLQGAAVEGVAAGSSCSGGRGYRELMQWRAWLQGAPAVEGVAAGSHSLLIELLLLISIVSVFN